MKSIPVIYPTMACNCFVPVGNFLWCKCIEWKVMKFSVAVVTSAALADVYFMNNCFLSTITDNLLSTVLNFYVLQIWKTWPNLELWDKTVCILTTTVTTCIPSVSYSLPSGIKLAGWINSLSRKCVYMCNVNILRYIHMIK